MLMPLYLYLGGNRDELKQSEIHKQIDIQKDYINYLNQKINKQLVLDIQKHLLLCSHDLQDKYGK